MAASPSGVALVSPVRGVGQKQLFAARKSHAGQSQRAVADRSPPVTPVPPLDKPRHAPNKVAAGSSANATSGAVSSVASNGGGSAGEPDDSPNTSERPLLQNSSRGAGNDVVVIDTVGISSQSNKIELQLATPVGVAKPSAPTPLMDTSASDTAQPQIAQSEASSG